MTRTVLTYIIGSIPSPSDSVLVIGRVLVYRDSDLSTAYVLSTQIRLSPPRGGEPSQ